MAAKKSAKDLADQVSDDEQQGTPEADNQHQDDQRKKAAEMEKMIAAKEARDAAAKKTATKAKATKPGVEVVVSKRGYITHYVKGK